MLAYRVRNVPGTIYLVPGFRYSSSSTFYHTYTSFCQNQVYLITFVPRSGINHFCAKIRYTWWPLCQNQLHTINTYKTHARNPPIGQPHVVPHFGLKRSGTSDFDYSAQLVYSYTSVVVLLLYSDHKNNQSTHIRMYEPYKNSKNYYQFKVLEAYFPLLLLFRRKKKTNKLTLSRRPKTPLVACVFYLVLICTLFWLNVSRYTCFWHLPYIYSHLNSRTRVRTN